MNPLKLKDAAPYDSLDSSATWRVCSPHKIPNILMGSTKFGDISKDGFRSLTPMVPAKQREAEKEKSRIQAMTQLESGHDPPGGITNYFLQRFTCHPPKDGHQTTGEEKVGRFSIC